MAGISSTTLFSRDLENRKKFNGIEFNKDLGLDQYDAFYRTLDPQIGRFLQVDPKIESADGWSSYCAMLDNPIKNIDPLGDSTIPGAGFWINAWEGFKDGWKDTKKFVNSLGTVDGWLNLAEGVGKTNPLSPDGAMHWMRVGANMKIPKNEDEWGHAAGYVGEKSIESAVISKGVGMAANATRKFGSLRGIANPIPDELARVIPNSPDEITTLGKPGASDVFVTSSKAIKGLNASQIAEKLDIPESNSGFTVISFPVVPGIASPIRRTTPGFVGGGKTAGGAPEWVIPNQLVPKNARIKKVN